MSGDERDTAELVKTCLESGCKETVGREHDYCSTHRE
jgi:hypothetical protein